MYRNERESLLNFLKGANLFVKEEPDFPATNYRDVFFQKTSLVLFNEGAILTRIYQEDCLPGQLDFQKKSFNCVF